MDMTGLEDSDVQALASGNLQAVSDKGLQHIAQGGIGPPTPSVGQMALAGVSALGRGIDSYGGDASTRAAIYAAQNGQDPLKAAFNAYGDSDHAPTGKMIAMKAGVPDTPMPPLVQQAGSILKNATPMGQLYQNLMPENMQKQIESTTPADLAGAGVNALASPLNLIPFGKPIVRGIDLAGDLLRQSYLGQKTGQAVDAAGRGVAKVAEAVSGAPYQDIKTYWNQKPVVNQAIQNSGGNSAALADLTRSGYQDMIGAKRAQLNDAISKAEAGANSQPTVSIAPLLSRLDIAKSRLHPTLDASQIKQIDELSDALKEGADEGGKVSANDLVKITASLQNKAKASYGLAPNGAALGNQASQGAAGAAAEARTLRNANIPGVEQPFQELSDINQAADVSNPNLFVPGKPDAALFAAGSGKNDRALQSLEQMGQAVGGDFVGPAQVASSARTFMAPSLTPTDTTGKSVYRALLGMGLAGEGAGLLGAPIQAVGKLGAMAASPAGVKLGMDAAKLAGSIPKGIASKIGSMSNQDFLKAFGMAKTPEAVNKLNEYFSQGPRASGAGTQSGGPSTPEKTPGTIESKPGVVPMDMNQAREQFRLGN